MYEYIIIIVNLFILESLLSVDNAAVLAVMVKDLPDNQKSKALRYGLIGAYVFRGLCLFLAAWLVKILWLKIVGGLYLIYLALESWRSSGNESEKSLNTNSIASKLGISIFWATVIAVEVVDLVFSIDNVFAAVALSDNFWVIMIGVGIGILAMRFVASWFVKLMERYPSLSVSAFLVIGLLGLKLAVSGTMDYIPAAESYSKILSSHTFDLVFSAVMMSIFFVPILLTRKR